MYLAIYFCIADIILFGQWIYYSRQARYRRLSTMPDIVVGDLPEITEADHHHHRSPHHLPSPSLSSRPRHSRRTTSATAGSTTATAILLSHQDLVLQDVSGTEMNSDLEQAEGLSPLMHRPRPRRATTASDISHRRRYMYPPMEFLEYWVTFFGGVFHRTYSFPMYILHSTSIVLFGLMLLTLRQTIPSGSYMEAHYGSGLMTSSSAKVTGRIFTRADIQQDEALLADPTPDPNIVQLGRIFAWVCTVFYLSSRMPQLWKNVRNLTTTFTYLLILKFSWSILNWCYLCVYSSLIFWIAIVQTQIRPGTFNPYVLLGSHGKFVLHSFNLELTRGRGSSDTTEIPSGGCSLRLGLFRNLDVWSFNLLSMVILHG